MSAVFYDVVAACALVVSIVCTILILHPKYDDGLMGRVALALIAIAGYARAAVMIQGNGEPSSNIGALLWIGLCIFLCRHYRNFYQRKDLPAADKVKTGKVTRKSILKEN